jgi:3',5'-cyclic AMP phosphodiesterase CpdA
MLQGLIGPGGRLFAEVRPGPDETAFQIDNTSVAYYHSLYFLKHRSDLQPIPPLHVNPPHMNLADILGANPIATLTAAKKIIFHSVGDTGAAKVNLHQTAAQAVAQQARVADAMAADVQVGGANTPSFFFHLGDLVYHFGEGQYYYDQFYEPYRAYDRPIFAVPGNHDGMVFGDAPDLPKVPTLMAFLRNFCAANPGPSPDAGGLVRSTMNQPGVYFTLDAPFVSIIGLYSNVLDGPGVISSQGGHYPIVGDEQVAFLQAELARLKPQRTAHERAVILAVHHPPVSADSKHGGGTGLADDIDTACRAAGMWPDAILSGHAHLYQRFSRHVDGRDIPYITSGSGGFAVTPPQTRAAPGTVFGEYTLVKAPIVDFGYLTVKVDMSSNAKTLTIAYRSPGRPAEHDSVVVHL